MGINQLINVIQSALFSCWPPPTAEWITSLGSTVSIHISDHLFNSMVLHVHDADTVITVTALIQENINCVEEALTCAVKTPRD